MYLEFEITNAEPKVTWNLARDQADIHLFRVGQRVKLKYVLQRSQLSGQPVRTALEIRIELRAETGKV